MNLSLLPWTISGTSSKPLPSLTSQAGVDIVEIWLPIAARRALLGSNQRFMPPQASILGQQVKYAF